MSFCPDDCDRDGLAIVAVDTNIDGVLMLTFAIDALTLFDAVDKFVFADAEPMLMLINEAAAADCSNCSSAAAAAFDCCCLSSFVCKIVVGVALYDIVVIAANGFGGG